MIPRTRLLWLLSAGLIFGTLQPEVNAIELADKTFGVITNKDPFIINFYAPWCEGCIKFGPEWARLVQRFGSFEQNTTRFGEINIQNEKGLAKVFHSPHVPSIVRYHDGSIWRYEGLMTYDSLSRFFFDEPKSWSARAPDLKFPRTSEILGPLSPAQKRALLDETEKPPLIDPEQVELVRRTLPVKLNLKQLIKTTAEGRWIVNMCTPYVASCLHAIPKWVDAMNTMRSGSNTNDIQFGEIVFESTILKQYRLLPAGPVLLMFNHGVMSIFTGDIDELANSVDVSWAEVTPVEPIRIQPLTDNTQNASDVIFRLFGIIGCVIGACYVLRAVVSWSCKAKSF